MGLYAGEDGLYASRRLALLLRLHDVDGSRDT